MDIYKKLRKIREYREFSQEYVASRLGMTQNSYSKVERGIGKITVDRLEKICEVLQVDSQAVLVADERSLLQIINGRNDHNVYVSSENSEKIRSSLCDLYKLRIQHLKEEITFLESSLEKSASTSQTR
ncbi:helix-turn-helix domain-containing protein [Tunicatimonas pelagia]|uniref:helix-turn-helix domain-containing protein n=1 Tax=Tunicatimonas pelagia TaxID=931531 RepID=UPI0026652F75|nr:helix-turn-helix domain-containing protein [Tunicatimonas pelagia]WKN41944.1 helix-turn-helix domain-containing protein [Tunicatimonas pelagia]